jgi:TM2 domain-containing membrane protein YozV
MAAPLPTPVLAPPPQVRPAEKFCVTCGAKILAQAVVCPNCGCAQPGADPGAFGTRPASANGNRIAAGLLAILLGVLGIHKFVLGYTGAGIIMLLVSIFGSVLFFTGPIVMAIIGLIEGILYLSMSDEEFERVHGARQRAWF